MIYIYMRNNILESFIGPTLRCLDIREHLLITVKSCLVIAYTNQNNPYNNENRRVEFSKFFLYKVMLCVSICGL